jgi:hypothetical protein
LNQEFPDQTIPDLLRMLVRHQERIARDVQLSKEKDDNRGGRIIPGYEDAHRLAKDDLFVQETWNFTGVLNQEVQSLLSRVSSV